MPKKFTPGETHRLVVEVDKKQFRRFRASLLQRGLTVSNWARMKMDEELHEPVRGKFKTKYLG